MLKNKIIELRKQGFSYREIEALLDCSKGTISYYCVRFGLDDTGKKLKKVTLEQKRKIAKYCKSNSVSDAVKHFKLSLSTIKNYRNYRDEQQE